MFDFRGKALASSYDIAISNDFAEAEKIIFALKVEAKNSALWS
jgi:hypothetical protein